MYDVAMNDAMTAAEQPGASEHHPAHDDVDRDGGHAADPEPRREDLVLAAPGEPPEREAADQEHLEHG